ncbi:MAG TPA: ion channel [Solirubrobacterales bacterium]|nr:ion channel [Solirubrobacterales bacterium]
METAARRARTRERWLQRAERASDAFGLVFVLVMITYVLASLLENRGWGSVALTLATSATSVVALVSSHARPRLVRLALTLSVLTVVLAAVGAASDNHLWLNLATLIQVSLLAVAMGAVLRRVVMAPEVGSRTILGALSVYAVLGILFTFLYGVIDRVQGGPFFEGHPNPTGTDFLFFSYTTLTTTGYGNLVPGGQPGRLTSGLEMMAGQIFLVTLVAGLVSLWRPGEAIRQRRQRRSGEGPPTDTPPASPEAS